MASADRCSMEELKAFGTQTHSANGRRGPSLLWKGKRFGQIRRQPGHHRGAASAPKLSGQTESTVSRPPTVQPQRNGRQATTPMKGTDTFGSSIPSTASTIFRPASPSGGCPIALLENFWPIFGVFFMPSTGDLFQASADEAAFHGEARIEIPSPGKPRRRKPSADLFPDSTPITEPGFPAKFETWGAPERTSATWPWGGQTARSIANVLPIRTWPRCG